MIGDQPLEHGDRSLLPVRRSNGDLTHEGRNSREAGDFGQETADFDVGVFTRLKASEELQNQLFAINNRSVGLLRGANA